MALEHNRLQYVPDFQRGVRLITGLGEEQEGLVRLGETLQAMFEPGRNPEERFLIGERLEWGFAEQAAVAAQNQAIGIRNPTGSSWLVVIETIEASNAATSARVLTLHVRAQSATGVTAISATFGRDTRLAATPVTVSSGTVLLSGSAAGAATFGSGMYRFTLPPVTSIERSVPFILGPGAELWAVQTTVNELARVSFSWRERLVKPGWLRPR